MVVKRTHSIKLHNKEILHEVPKRKLMFYTHFLINKVFFQRGLSVA